MTVRNLTVLTRKPTLSRAEFSRYWAETHGPLVEQLPGIARYSQNHVVAAGTRTGYPTADYEIDGIVDFVFDSQEAATAAFESELGQRIMRDASTFIERMCVYTIEERVVVDRT